MKGSEVSPPAFALPLFPFSRKDNAKVSDNLHNTSDAIYFNVYLTLYRLYQLL